MPSANVSASTSSVSSTHRRRREDSVSTSTLHLNPASSSLHNPHPHRVSSSDSVLCALLSLTTDLWATGASVLCCLLQQTYGQQELLFCVLCCRQLVDRLMGHRSHETNASTSWNNKSARSPINTTGPYAQPQ